MVLPWPGLGNKPRLEICENPAGEWNGDELLVTAVMDPKAVNLVSPQELEISWKDGVNSRYMARDLRLACPCAQCVEEWTGKKLLQDDKVRQDIVLLSTELVGRYALTFTWNDGHQTGIFSFKYLRGLDGLAQ